MQAAQVQCGVRWDELQHCTCQGTKTGAEAWWSGFPPGHCSFLAVQVLVSGSTSPVLYHRLPCSRRMTLDNPDLDGMEHWCNRPM